MGFFYFFALGIKTSKQFLVSTIKVAALSWLTILLLSACSEEEKDADMKLDPLAITGSMAGLWANADNASSFTLRGSCLNKDTRQTTVVVSRAQASAITTETTTCGAATSNKWSVVFNLGQETDGKLAVDVSQSDGSGGTLEATGVIIKDTQPPAITGVANDTTPKLSKPWDWGCDDSNSPCRFRHLINNKSSHSFQEKDEYTEDINATQFFGNATFYLHLQAKDVAGNESRTMSFSVILDNQAPSISSMSIPGTNYLGGEEMVFRVVFNEAVAVSGTPRIGIRIGEHLRYAQYFEGTGTSTLGFRYTVMIADIDIDGIVIPVKSIDLSVANAAVADLAGNGSAVNFGLPSSLSDVVVAGMGRQVVLSTRSLSQGENAASASYSLRLSTRPSANVVIGLSVGDSTVAGITSATTITFTPDNWARPQSVTVVTVNDDVDNDPHRSTAIAHAVSDGEYAAVVAGSVEVVAVNDDTRGVTLSKNSFDLAENAGRASYTVRLNSQPTANVVLAISSSQATIARIVSSASVTFTPSNWQRPVTVMVEGVNDAIDNNLNRMAALTHQASGGDYASTPAVVARVEVLDDDTRGVRVSASAFAIAEVGGRASYTLVLETEPSGNVTVLLESGDGTVVTVSPPAVIFNTSNWSNAQTVNLVAVDDDIDSDPSRRANIFHRVLGGDYAGFNIANVVVTATDSDVRGVSVSTSSLNIAEDGSAAYTVQLMTEPAGRVEIALAVEDEGVVRLEPSLLAFTGVNWNAPASVQVRAVDDDVDNLAHRGSSISHTVSGGDYGAVTAANVNITLIDDDIRGVMVSERLLAVHEGAGTNTYQVQLTSQPTGEVSMALAVGTSGVVAVAPQSMSFIASDWNVAQTVTLTGVNDMLVNSPLRTTSISHTASGADYASVVVAQVKAIVLDDDATDPRKLLALGANHSCVVLSGGSIKCWGKGGNGRLGQGGVDNIGDGVNEMGSNLSAINLGTGRTATAVATGGMHTCALLDNSSIKCWGDNSLGQLGQGDTNNRGDGAGELGNSLMPIDLGSGRRAIAVVAGHSRSCALLDNYLVKCWGEGGSGQLGQGNTDNLGDSSGEMGDKLETIALGAGRRVMDIVAGDYHTCVLLDNDRVKCWGDNSLGQLGQGNTDNLGDSAGRWEIA